MKQYIATFYTHLSALMTHRQLEAAGFSARMAPVPRALSSSCGTCVFYSAPNDCKTLLDDDAEAVYEDLGGSYQLLYTFD